MKEHILRGGLSSIVKKIALDEKTKSTIKSFTLKDRFINFYVNHSQLLNKHDLSVKKF